MTQTSLKAPETLKCKKTIITLTALSIVLILFALLTEWIHIRKGKIEETFLGTICKYLSPLDYLFVLVKILPSILFILYIIFFYNKGKGKNILPIIMGILAIVPMNFYGVGFYDLYVQMWLEFYIYFIEGIIDFCFCGYCVRHCLTVIFMLCAITAIVITLKRKFKKRFFVILLSIMIACKLAEVLTVITIIILSNRSDWYSFRVNGIFDSLGIILLCVAMILFVSKNKIKKSYINLSPEKALKLLKAQFEDGVISEEEYHSQRTEIISKL